MDYIELLKRSLLGLTSGPVEVYWPRPTDSEWYGRFHALLQRFLVRRGGAVLAAPMVIDPAADPHGDRFVSVLPPGIMTMIGQTRMQNLQDLMIDVIDRDVPGDCIETGVWRGGATIFMRGILKALGRNDKTVFVADSFAGLPRPNAEKYPADADLDLSIYDALAVSLEDVKANFERHGLLDGQVTFVKGWFRDTLPALRDHTWSLIRLDGDYYESTMDALVNLYPGLSPGGWIIVDDYLIDACRHAVTDYRTEHAITEEIIRIDQSGICWKKAG